jgi:hypothetical protein
MLPVVRGHNLWVLARTDRDGATAEEVRETAGAVLARKLGQASPFGTRSVFEHLSVPGSDASRYVIGAARPVVVTASQPDTVEEAMRLSRPEGELLGRHLECDVVRSVNAERPWIVVAEFDWRAPSTQIPWPRHAVNFLGFVTDDPNDLDWLLLAATHTGKARESDTTLLGEVSRETRKAIESAGGAVLRVVIPVALVLAGGAALWYAAKRRVRG